MSNILKEELSKQEDEQIRSNIERIISSYRHVWDIYTELLQNSADAIFTKFEGNLKDGKIQLYIFPSERKIIIRDNGVGISEDDISKILVTGKSIKRINQSGNFGFMGFGFTFVAFQSEYLQIESIHGGRKASRTYKDLYKYVFSNEDIPNSEEESANIESCETTGETGTTITVVFPSEFPQETTEESLAATFRLANNLDAIKAVLRTKTIVGYLEPLFSGADCFEFSLEIDGEDVEINTGYLTTREIVREVLNSENQFYDRETQYEPLVAATIALPVTAQEAARKTILLDEKVSNVVIGERSPITARMYISATSKSHINKYNERLNADDGDPDLTIEHGVWLSIAGMPIGVCLDAFEHAQYLPFTVVVDVTDASIRQELDAGRKGISQYRMRQISEKVRMLLADRNFIKYRRYVLGGGDTRISDPLYDPKAELLNKFSEKHRVESDLITQYLPPLEEQEVITLFYELTSRQILRGYIPKIISGYQVYDGLYGYGLEKNGDSVYSSTNQMGISDDVFKSHGNVLSKDVLIEFKLNLSGIYKDIETNKKDMGHIDILVCWDTDYVNKDVLLQQKGDVLREVDRTTNVFYGVTHQLIGAGRQQPLPIIELKSVLNIG